MNIPENLSPEAIEIAQTIAELPAREKRIMCGVIEIFRKGGEKAARLEAVMKPGASLEEIEAEIEGVLPPTSR